MKAFGILYIIVLIVLNVLNLSQGKSTIASAKETTRIDNYKCTEEQLKNVEKEFDLCVRTNIPSEQCFYAAKSTQCEKV